MKNLKFIPSLLIISLASCIVPFSLTSCSNQIKLRDITDMDEPEFATFVEDPANPIETSEDVIKAYKEFAETRYDDFLADMEWSTKQNWMSFLDYSNVKFQLKFDEEDKEWLNFVYEPELKSLQFGMTKPTFDSVEISPPGSGESETFLTASFRTRTVLEAKVKTSYWNDSEEYIEHHIFLDCTADLKNILMHAYYAQRNDKTIINKSRKQHPGFYSSAWIITPHTDSPTQYQYQYDLEEYNIGYNATMTDEITKKYSTGEVVTYTNTGRFSGDMDTPSEMDEICALKSYDWQGTVEHPEGWDDTHVLIPNNDFYPSSGWRYWFDQDPASYIANAVVPDMFTHYFLPTLQPTKEDPEGYVEATESPRANFKYNYEWGSGQYPLTGWAYQVRIDKEHIDNLKVNNIEYEILNHSEPIELAEVGDKSGIAHYFTPTPDKPITLSLPTKVTGIKPLAISSKISLPLYFTIANADNFVLDTEAKDKQPYIISDLQFEIPKDLQIQYTINIDDGSGDKDVTGIVDFSKANNIITISKYAKK